MSPEDAERILRRVALIVERLKREPELLAGILGMMVRDSTHEVGFLGCMWTL